MKIVDISFKLLILFFLFWFCNSSLALWSIFNILSSYFSWFSCIFVCRFWFCAFSSMLSFAIIFFIPCSFSSVYCIKFLYLLFFICLWTDLVFCWSSLICVLLYFVLHNLALPLLQYLFHVWVLGFLLHVFYFIFWCIHGSFANFFILPLLLFFFLLAVVVFGGL